MTVTEAAKALNVSRTVIGRQIRRGTLTATKYGRDYWILPEHLEAFRRLDRKEGRPRKAGRAA